jgi:hypothetical protein
MFPKKGLPERVCGNYMGLNLGRDCGMRAFWGFYSRIKVSARKYGQTLGNAIPGNFFEENG